MPGADTVRGGFDSHASPPAWPGFRALAAAGMLLAALLAVPAEGAQPNRDRGPSPGSAALRSLILPGWGQTANRKWLKAVGFAGAYGGLLGWGISINQDKQDALGRGDALAAAQFEDQRNAKYWLGGLTLLLAMVDAYVDAHLAHFDDRIDAEVGWIPAVGEPLVGIRVHAVLDGSEKRSR